MRVDKQKNMAKVIKKRLENPLQTTRDIAKAIGIDHGTVARLDKEVPQIATKDNRILGICDKDLEIVTLGQEEINRRLKDKEELSKMRTVEISQIIRENTARYSLFKGDATDKDGGLKNDFRNMSTEELLSIKNKK